MGNIIGILSTIVLISTLSTLIFAIGAYVAARRKRVRLDAEMYGEPPAATPPVPAADATPFRPLPAPVSAAAVSAGAPAPGRPVLRAHVEPSRPAAAARNSEGFRWR